MMMVDDLFAYISFLLQEKIFKGSTTMKEKKGILQNKCFMVYLYKNEMNKEKKLTYRDSNCQPIVHNANAITTTPRK